MNDSKLIISVKEARKRLGKKYEKFNDEEIEGMIQKLYHIANETVKAQISI